MKVVTDFLDAILAYTQDRPVHAPKQPDRVVAAAVPREAVEGLQEAWGSARTSIISATTPTTPTTPAL